MRFVPRDALWHVSVEGSPGHLRALACKGCHIGQVWEMVGDA